MKKDKVMHPVNSGRSGGLKQVNSSIIKGPTQTTENMNPYNRKGSYGKKGK